MAPVHYHADRFPPEERLDWRGLIPLIGPAAAAVARYDGVLAVSRDDDWTGWCGFFLEAVRLQAEDNLTRARGTIDLYDRMKGRFATLTRSRYAIRALDWIFGQPIFRSTHFVDAAGIPKPTARRIIQVLREDGILKVIIAGSGRRPAIFSFPDLLNIAEGTEVF